MHTKIFEATNGINWGKFLIGVFDNAELSYRSKVDVDRPMIMARGWTSQHFFMLDLQTGEGATFRAGGFAKADLDKHQVFVCPMYIYALEAMYEIFRFGVDLPKVPEVLDLDPLKTESALYGYRRPGPSSEPPPVL